MKRKVVSLKKYRERLPRDSQPQLPKKPATIHKMSDRRIHSITPPNSEYLIELFTITHDFPKAAIRKGDKALCERDGAAKSGDLCVWRRADNSRAFLSYFLYATPTEFHIEGRTGERDVCSRSFIELQGPVVEIRRKLAG